MHHLFESYKKRRWKRFGLLGYSDLITSKPSSAFTFQGDFYYLGLENGKLVLQIYTGGVTFCRLSLSENLEYNNNKWHFVVADRIDRQGISHVLRHQIMTIVTNNLHLCFIVS